MKTLVFCSFLFCTAIAVDAAPSPNRLAVADDFCDIYYPNAAYPKLTTEQWMGEEGVEAALILAIDDMRDPPKYEAYLRPILERLKQIDGRAPVSIMTCKVDPNEPLLQNWLKEGVSLEAHTIDHPCPILDKNDFTAAKSTYDRCVDLMNSIPGNHPLAFRTPCMDGINSASPRLFAEIMLRTTPSGGFLTMSSSIGMLLTPEDPENPRELVTDSEGHARFDKYLLPGWVNYIKDYPYPWVIGNKLWETGFCVPDDYEGSRPNGDKNQHTIDDMKATIDAVVAKKGLWVMTFHPYNWITNRQVIELIDHTVAKHGTRAKFLTFREAQERIDKNLLAGHSLRASDGSENGVRLLDLNDDGFLDVVIGNESTRMTRLWDPKSKHWTESAFPTQIRSGAARFGSLQRNGLPTVVALTETERGVWNFDGARWLPVENGTAGLELNGEKIFTARDGIDQGVRLRDLDGDGISELIVSNPHHNAVFSWDSEARRWNRLPYTLPEGVSIVTAQGGDNGARFVDFNHDGHDDLIFSNEKEFGLWLFVPEDFLGFKRGFSRQIMRGRRGELPEIPMISRGGAFPNNSVWFTSDTMCVQNEDTGKLPDLLQRVSFKDLLDGFQPQAKSPEESRALMETIPGFEVDLVAHEPEVESPVYLDWSADGSLWVVEMRDYPQGIDGHAGGVIKHLQDLDGDGVYEKSTIFLDHLNFPNGLFPWRKGLLISAAPEILYAEDTDGDGRADKTEVLFTGFVQGNQQHRANGYEWGLDGWLYGANGDSGGSILSKKTGRRVSISRQDFRFRPDTGEFEAIEGNAQFGRHRDDRNNWFGGANYTWGWHYYITEDYLRHNPALTVRGTYQPYATAPDSARVYPISRVQQRFNDIGMAGHVTSACSFSPYRDSLFGGDFTHSIFISEPVHNLVHREVLERDGVSFRSHRAAGEEEREFLASRDPWFRPTTLKTGPDGALYACDMYRLVIEHPEWIPADVQKRMNLRAGEGMGRIYRVRPKDKILRKIPNLAVLKNDALVEVLESPSGWQRDTAQRLLFERGAKEVVPEIEFLLTKSTRAEVRLQALATIDLLGGVTRELLSAQSTSQTPEVRALAIRYSERYGTDENQRSLDLWAKLLESPLDPDLRVRYQLALSIGAGLGALSNIAAEKLGELAAHDGANEAMITAVLSASAYRPDIVLGSALKHHATSPRLISGLLQTSARGNQNSLAVSMSRTLLDHILTWPAAEKLPLLAAAASSDADIRDALPADSRWSILLEETRHFTQDSTVNEDLRAGAITLLGDDATTLCALAASASSPKIQQAALGRLTALENSSTAHQLIAALPGSPAPNRSGILSVLLTRPAWTEALVRALEANQLHPTDLAPAIQQALLNHRSDEIRRRAAALLHPSTESREAVVNQYLEKLRDLKGDSGRGRALFEANCGVCHKAGEIGTGSGPNLATLQNRGAEQILTAILDPNRAVEDRYRAYVAELKDGDEISGLLLSETANSVTLALISGAEQSINRREIRSLTAQKRSLMPEGFEQFLQPQDLADLVSFIQTSAAP